MDRDEALELLRGGPEGIIEWNRRRRITTALPALNDVDLRNTWLPGANLADADLRGANLSRAALEGANLRNARLTGADLRGADLTTANVSIASLNDAVLDGAHLYGTVFFSTDLKDACFSDAWCGATMFAYVDLSVVKGLETVNHRLPSEIGVHTLYRSRGKIPEEFLRGCGVWENLIEYLPSLVSGRAAFEFYSCFINDTNFLVVGAGGNPCWAYACYGRKIEDAVERRRNGQRLLIVHEFDFWDAVEDVSGKGVLVG